MSNKTGLLLVNLGSPDAPTPRAVKRYLKQFLSDRHVIELNPVLWWPILHGIILRTRPQKSAQLYAKIWRKNSAGEFVKDAPLIETTRKQERALAAEMPHGVVTEIAMRYGRPSIEAGMRSLINKGCTKITVLPLYPQYAKATTASVIAETKVVLKGLPLKPEIQFIEDYHQDAGYIKALAESCRAHIEGLGWTPDKILVSFHGIPKASTAKGDPYEGQCQRTYKLLSQALGDLNIPLVLCYQSRFGPKEWLGPYISTCLGDLAGQGANVLVITPGFSADCLETLEEIALNERQKFVDAGGKKYACVPCLNDDELHIEALANIVRGTLEG